MNFPQMDILLTQLFIQMTAASELKFEENAKSI